MVHPACPLRHPHIRVWCAVLIYVFSAHGTTFPVPDNPLPPHHARALPAPPPPRHSPSPIVCPYALQEALPKLSKTLSKMPPETSQNTFQDTFQDTFQYAFRDTPRRCQPPHLRPSAVRAAENRSRLPFALVLYSAENKRKWLRRFLSFVPPGFDRVGLNHSPTGGFLSSNGGMACRPFREPSGKDARRREVSAYAEGRRSWRNSRKKPCRLPRKLS